MSTSSASMKAHVSVIVPTLAALARRSQLRRAIDSIRGSSTSPVRIIVVVNGNRFDEGVCDWLRRQKDVQFEYVETPSAPGAVVRGREVVSTPYFSTLDDDDEYLGGGTDEKIKAMQAEDQTDLLVANAYRHVDGQDTLIYRNLQDVPDNPLKCLMSFPWLNGANALYRTSSISVTDLANYHPHVIWTWLAFKLAMSGKKVGVLAKPTCRIHDTSESLSKSNSYFQSRIPLFERMLDAAPPPEIAKLVKMKLSAAYHDASVAALDSGHRSEAFKNHWQSLTRTGGLKYLTYTRHLFK